VAAVGAAIAIERYVTLTRLGAKNRNAWAQLQPVLASGDFDKARAMTQNDDTAISQLLAAAWRARVRCGAARTSRWRWKRA
jgi:biopolymer transport protein ExbB